MFVVLFSLSLFSFHFVYKTNKKKQISIRQPNNNGIHIHFQMSNDDLDRLARQMLLDEAKQNKIRAETQGALGWQRPKLVTNRKFLRNTLISNAVHNIHKNEQEKQQRLESSSERRKQDDYKHSRKRSATPPSSSSRQKPDKHDRDRSSSSSSKRTKKEK